MFEKLECDAPPRAPADHRGPRLFTDSQLKFQFVVWLLTTRPSARSNELRFTLLLAETFSFQFDVTRLADRLTRYAFDDWCSSPVIEPLTFCLLYTSPSPRDS